MRWPSIAPLTQIARRIGLPVGVAGAGAGGAWLAVVHGSHNSVSIIVAAAVTILGLCLAAAPKIIEARSKANVARTNAQTDSAVRMLHAKTRAEILRKGLDSSATEQAARMLAYELLDPSLPKDQRLQDKTLVEIARIIPTAVEIPPSTESSGDSTRQTNGVVVNLKPED